MKQKRKGPHHHKKVLVKNLTLKVYHTLSKNANIERDCQNGR